MTSIKKCVSFRDYSIESEFEEDIIHPMVPIYFTTLEDGVYSKSSNWIDGKPVVPNNIGLA